MPSPSARAPRKRNASAKRAKPRHRNAGPAPAKDKPAKPAKDKPSGRMSVPQLAVKIAASSIGSAASSVVGGNAVKIGIPPLWTALGLTTLGSAIAGFATGENTREVGTGWLSAVASQLVLMAMAPAKQTFVVAPVSAPTPKPKNADLGVLPPGALDSAFERARAEMAVRQDVQNAVYPIGYPEIPILAT